MKRNKRTRALLCGLLGCLCYGGGDWLMLYGDPAHAGALIWLTKGAAQIPQWRYDLAMALAFPGIILYGVALFAVDGYILFGEWCYFCHSVAYNSLPDWFIAFDIFDKEKKQFLSVQRRNACIIEMNLALVPQLFHGHVTKEMLDTFLGKSAFGDEKSEGLYFRIDSNYYLNPWISSWPEQSETA